MIVGLTGGIGSGKSAAADFFAAQGIELVDTDVLAREVVESGSPALAAIAERFGSEILDASGALDRARLRAIIFANPEQKAWLEGLLHPLINALMLSRLRRMHRALLPAGLSSATRNRASKRSRQSSRYRCLQRNPARADTAERWQQKRNCRGDYRLSDPTLRTAQTRR